MMIVKLLQMVTSETICAPSSQSKYNFDTIILYCRPGDLVSSNVPMLLIKCAQQVALGMQYTSQLKDLC